MAILQTLAIRKYTSLLLYQDSDMKDPVVLKILNALYPTSEQIDAFYHEYEMTHALDSPVVRRALAKTTWQNQPALRLAYIAGKTLREAVGEVRQSAHPTPLLWEFSLKLCRALQEIHAVGLVHCDFNPDNVLVENHSQSLKVIDFELSYQAEQSVTRAFNGVHGTLSYLAPEQSGRTPDWVDHRTDLYALGVALYELWAGELPFGAEDQLGMIYAHLAREPIPLHLKLHTESDSMIALSACLMKLLAKSPEQRYQTSEGVYLDLLEIQAYESSSSKADTFQPGRKDKPHELKLATHLYGRELEQQTLRRFFEQVQAQGGSGVF